MALPTLADLKKHLNIPAEVTSDDDELQDVLDAAVELAESIAGPLTSGDVTEVHRLVDTDTLILRQMPTGELTAVSAGSGASKIELTLADYELDAASGLLRVADGSRFRGTYTVEYTSGTDTASTRLGVLIIAAHLWETQRMPLQSDAPAGFGGDETGTVVGRGYALPNRALELLRPRTGSALA